MNMQEILNILALTRINYFHLAGLRQLYDELGSATAVIENRHHLQDVLPDASPRLAEGLKGIDDAMKRAETELEYDMKNDILPIPLHDSNYPQRLKECDDAPLLLFYKGNAPLNAKRVVSIVGTRKCTTYGQDLIQRFVKDLRQLCPQVLIVSGMAYGVDINAHRSALENGFDTVAVLAHGLDYLYPPRHKPTADAMLHQGGLLTEFFTHTNADKVNFVRRNRIVAGMADCTILVESAAHGGGMITARLSRDYNRDTFAFPGAVGAKYSEGCNRLIREQTASLITCAQDFVEAMGWQEDTQLQQAQQQGIERQLFPTLSADEQKIINVLSADNDQQINRLTVTTNIPISRLSALLFELEMKGILRSVVGGKYHLIK